MIPLILLLIGISGSINVNASTQLTDIISYDPNGTLNDSITKSLMQFYDSDLQVNINQSYNVGYFMSPSVRDNIIIYENYFTSGTNTYGYRTDYSANQKIKKGYTSNNLYSPDYYYVYDSHGSYPNKYSQSMQIPFSNDYISTTGVSSSFDYSDSFLFYKYYYFLGDLFGAPNLDIIDDYGTFTFSDYCNSAIVSASGASSLCNNLDFQLSSFHLLSSQESTPSDLLSAIYNVNESFAAFMDYFVNNSNAGILNNTDFASNQTRPFYNFLHNYTLTSYDSSNGGRNYSLSSSSFVSSLNVFPDFRVVTSNGDVSLDTFCLVYASPVIQQYSDNQGRFHTLITFKLEFCFLSYIPPDTEFTSFKVRNFLKYQFPVNTNKSIFEFFIPSEHYYIISRNSNSSISSDDIYNFLYDIYVIGPFLATLYLFISFINEVLNSFLYFFYGFPSWFYSGLKIIIACIIVRVIYKLIRG